MCLCNSVLIRPRDYECDRHHEPERETIFSDAIAAQVEGDWHSLRVRISTTRRARHL